MIRTLFNEWLYNHSMVFPLHEYNERLAIFEDNHWFIEAVNAENRGYTLGHNQWSGYTNEEYASFHRAIAETHSTRSRKPLNNLRKTTIVDVDWVAEGVVSSVKNQGSCGSCWSFSATEAVEGAVALSTGRLYSLAEQQLVDCDTRNHGCFGGSMALALEWVKTNGLCEESEYPYTGHYFSDCEACTTVKDTKAITITAISNDRDSVLTALQKAPLSIAVEADGKEWQFYESGVLSTDCGDWELDHGVLMTGYDSSEKTFTIKNSWSTDWGEEGYVRIADDCDGGMYGMFESVLLVE